MGRRFAYFYLMTPDPDAVRRVAPEHAAYWNGLRLPGYVGGPFGDRSGGLITFDADDDAEARRVVDADPFILEAVVDAHWLKEWAASG